MPHEIKYLLHGMSGNDYEVVFPPNGEEDDDDGELNHTAHEFEAAYFAGRPFRCFKWRHLDLFGRTDYEETDPLIIRPEAIESLHRQDEF